MLSDSPMISTGYSNQSKLLAKYLNDKGHEVHYLSVSYVGQPIKHVELFDGTKFDYKIYGTIAHPYFGDQIPTHLKQTKSDIFFILLDTFMLHGDPKNPANGWFLGLDLSPARSLMWFPTDGGSGLPAGCENILKKLDRPIAMSAFGKKQVMDYHSLNTGFIPHGTEPDRFYKLPDEQRAELRKKWNLQNKFVVGVVARNQPRKMIDRTFKAFSLAKEKMPNAILLLHMDPNDAAAPWPIVNLIRKYNLENRVRFTGMSAMRSFDWDEMNHLYNLMDCFFLSTSGEGFGIPIIEAMSCQVPVLATSYTTTAELVELNNAGEGIKLSGVDKLNLFDHDSKEYDKLSMSGTLTGSWEVERGLCDINDAAEKLIKLYNNPELCKKYGENGRSAVLAKYDFNKHVAPEFEKEMENLLKNT